MKRDTLPELDSHALYLRLIKHLGRNARQHGDPMRASGVLDAADADALWSAVLRQQFTPAQEAALLMGLRVHGESAAMLAAFVRASRAHVHWIASPHRPMVVLPCLGAMRKQPSLAALLAIELAAAGLPTLIVTASSAAPSSSCSSAAVLSQLGMAAASDCEQAAQQLAGERFAWISLETVSPLLARLIARRAELGFRNSAHTMIKLLSPIAVRSILVAHYTHGAYRDRLADAIELLNASALLVRGTEGDPIAWEADSHPPLAWCGGSRVELPEDSARSNQRPRPTLSQGDPVHSSVVFIREVLRGSQPCPAAINAQVRQLSFIALSMRSATAAEVSE
jgi:anthranilate phosphoribosyltransferase